METTGILIAKAGNGTGFKLEGVDGWFNASEAVVPYLAQIQKGSKVNVVYTQKGTMKIVTKISEVKNAVPEKNKKTEGKTTIDNTNKASNTKSSFDYSERDAQIRRGNALNAAGAALSGNMPGATPDSIAEALIIIAERALAWLEL